MLIVLFFLFITCQFESFYFNFRYDQFLIEYARYLPFGLVIASYFLRMLHNTKELIKVPLPIEEVVESVFDCGGDAVDIELRSLIMEIYGLYEKLNLKLEVNYHLESSHRFNKRYREV